MTKAKDKPKFAINNQLSGEHGDLPYRSKRKILSDGERRFYQDGLLPAIGDKHLILMKVRLTDVLHVPKKLWTSAAGRKIQQRHVDFLLVTKKALSIVAVVELDDASHLCDIRQSKDAYLSDALYTAKIPLIRFPIYRHYKPDLIRKIILDVLKLHPLKSGLSGKTSTRKRFILTEKFRTLSQSVYLA